MSRERIRYDDGLHRTEGDVLERYKDGRVRVRYDGNRTDVTLQPEFVEMNARRGIIQFMPPVAEDAAQKERARIIEIVRGMSTGDYGMGGVVHERTAESFQQELLEELGDPKLEQERAEAMREIEEQP